MSRGGLATRFGLLGALVGKFSAASVGFSLLLVLLPCIVFVCPGMKFQVGLDEGFVTKDAPSGREISAQKQFFGKSDQAKEWYMALFGIAKPEKDGSKGNMLQPELYNTFNAFYKQITQATVLRGPRGNFTYSQICQPLCDINEQMLKFMAHKSWTEWLGQKAHYPVSQMLSYDVNVGRHVFNRTLDSAGHLIGAEFVALFFATFVDGPLRQEELALFERTVSHEVALHNARGNNTRVELMAHGAHSVQGEMERGVMDAARAMLIGLALAFCLFVALHSLSGWLQSQFPFRRLLLALLCIPVPPLALLCSLLLLSLAGLPVNLLHFTSPLICLSLMFFAHGTFQIADAWTRLISESRRKQFSASERLASTFEQICPSFLCSQLSPVLGCALLSPLLPVLHYRCLCLTVALLLAFGLLLQLFLFAPLLARLCHHSCAHFPFLHTAPGMLEFTHTDHHPAMATKKPSIANNPPIVKLRAKNGHELIPPAATSNGGGCPRQAKRAEQQRAAKRRFRLALAEKSIVPLSSFLDSVFGRAFVLLCTGLLCWLALFRGVPSLANNMDYRRLLPRDSPARRGFDMMDNMWMDFFQIVYIVRRPPDFEDPAQFAQFKEFLAAITSIPQAMPPRTHMSWLFHYTRSELGWNVLGPLSPSTANLSSAVDMSKFGQFISTFPYNAWQSGVRYSLRHDSVNNRSRHSIDQMLVLIAHNQTRGLAGKRRLINQCRALAQQFPQFMVSIFDSDLRNTDIMDNIEPFLWRSLLALVLSVLLVSAVVFWHIGCALLAVLSALSTLAQFFGLGQLLGLELDLLIVPSSLAIACLCVHLSLPFLGDSLSSWAKEDRVRRALALSASPLAKSLLVWLAALSPLFFSSVFYFVLQARLMLLASWLTLWHGLFLLPALTCILPGKWLGIN